MAEIAIVYFSMKGETIAPGMKIVNLEKGHTAAAAEYIQEATGGKLFELETVKTYVADHMKMIYEAKEELEKGIRPELKSYPDMTPYDTVFLGFPNWWNTLPMPVVGFLEHCSWQEKKIIPFVTSGGSGFGKSLEDLEKYCPGAEIVEGGAFLGHEVDESREGISSWAKQAMTLTGRQKTEEQEEETPAKKEYFGSDTPKLGFGLMRLPKGKNGKIDVEETKEMVDFFMGAGLTYFDTAYVYDGGDSERAIKEALVDRYPRESYTLATKLCAWMGAHDEKTAKQQFYTSLERTGAGYFDYYLLHALQKDNYKTYDKYHIWDFVKEQKAKGLIKHWGFSFHAGPEILDEILTAHPDAEFVQLQLNYADWENPDVTARANYEVARKHGKSIVVMEPIKGGALADPPTEVQKIFKEADPDASFASWAIRYAASLDGIITVLSGMSNVEQMKDNLSYMKDFKPLDEKEREAIRKAQEVINGIKSIPCTACHYCTAGCPKKIHIPEIFAARNKQLLWGQLEEGEAAYAQAVQEGGRASDCIACGQCVRACPQQLPVIDWLKECAEQFD